MLYKMTNKFNPKIAIVAIGGGAANVLAHLQRSGMNGVKWVTIDTAPNEKYDFAHAIVLGDAGLGSGGNPEYGRKAAETAQEEIRHSVTGADMVIIISCLGGGAGSGAAPVVARIAREMNMALVMGMVTKPFSWESARRMDYAHAAIQEIKKKTHSLVVINNEKIIETMGDDVSTGDSFDAINGVFRDAVIGICKIMDNGEHVFGIDFKDVHEILNDCKVGADVGIGIGSATTVEGVIWAAERALVSPLLKDIDWTKVGTVLVSIVARAADADKLTDSSIVMNLIKKKCVEGINTSCHISYNEKMGDTIQVIVLATGSS